MIDKIPIYIYIGFIFCVTLVLIFQLIVQVKFLNDKPEKSKAERKVSEYPDRWGICPLDSLPMKHRGGGRYSCDKCEGGNS